MICYRPKLDISHLAILRSCVEYDKNWVYFGSTAGVSHWLSETEELGLVDRNRKPTKLGLALSDHLKLTKASAGRAYMWFNSEYLVGEARLYLSNSKRPS